MPKLEANLQWMFNEYDLLDRYDAAARAGFKGVELQAPYSATVEQIVGRLERNNLKHVIINSPVADPDTGISNIALRPDRTDLYMERTARAVEYAAGLGCTGVNIGVGSAPEGVDPDEIRATLISGTRDGRRHRSGRSNQYAGPARILRAHYGASAQRDR